MIATQAGFREGPKKGLNFAKFYTRGGRGLQQAHPETGLPLPQGTGRVPGRGYRAGRLPGGGRRIPGAARAAPGQLRPGRYGRTAGAATRGVRFRAGWLPGHTGGFPGHTGRLPGAGLLGWRAGYPGGYLCRGIPGRRATPAATGHTPGGAATPAARRLPVPGRLPGGLPGAAGAKNISGGAATGGKNPATALSRAYIEARSRQARRGYFLDKTAEKPLCFSSGCFFRRPE